MDQDAVIQVLPLPRHLPPVVIWSIYTVTCLGLIVTIVIIFLIYHEPQTLKSSTRKSSSSTPQNQRNNNYTTRKYVSERRPDNNHNVRSENVMSRKLDGNNSSSEKRRQSLYSWQTRRLELVTLEEVVEYECYFQPVYQNTTWLEGSDTKIIYLDVFGQPKVMNVIPEQSDPLETSEQRIMERNFTWLESNMLENISSEPTAAAVLSHYCPEIQICYLLDLWIFSYAINEYSNELSAHFLRRRRLRCLYPNAHEEMIREPRFQILRSHQDDYSTAVGKVHITKMIHVASTTFFVAAPINNVSLRFVYGGKPTRCLTCPQGNNNALECLSSDVQLSRNAKYYLLYCRGPEVPWTAVVSSDRNELVYRLINQENSRKLFGSRVQPITHELEVKLDSQHIARVRLHLPPYWKDKKTNECIQKLNLLLRIGDRQDSQIVNAEFDLSLTTYLTTVKDYAVIYADVRGSQFQNLEYNQLRFRRRELMQMSDYAKVVTHILTHYECIRDEVIGVFGENYGGHMVLNLVADNDEDRHISGDDRFRCGVAFNPWTRWQDYVYPYGLEHSTGVPGALRKKMFKRHYMAALVSRLRGKNFAIHTSRISYQHQYYSKIILKLLNHHNVQFEHKHYDDKSVKMCNSKLKSYKQASDFFDRCFGREIDIHSYSRKSIKK